MHHTAGQWESIWEVCACLVPKVSRNLLLVITRDRIWLELDLYSDLVWSFLRPKMRPVLALHLKINESCTAKKKKKSLKWEITTWTKMNLDIAASLIQIGPISGNQQKGKLRQGLIFHSLLPPVLLPLLSHMPTSNTILYQLCYLALGGEAWWEQIILLYPFPSLCSPHSFLH